LEQRVLSLDEMLFPEYMRELGYATACFGKWNLGFAPGHRPTERGFDEYLGNISGNCDYLTHVYNGRHDLYRGTEPVRLEGYTTEIFAQAACDFIRRNRERPFFVYVPFNAAHYPNPKNKPPGEPAIWQAPDEYFEAYGYNPATLDERRRYRAVVTALDAGIGKVVRQVDDLGLKDRSIVVVLSDNGAFMIPGRGLECASNRPLKGGGTLLYEGGIRVPCIVRWPGRIPAATVCREPLWSLDFLPMAVVAAGGTLPGDRVLDGRDPTAALAGEAPSPHDSLYFHYGSSSAVRHGRYKLYRRNGRSDWELFDLKTDVGETANQAARKPDVVKALAKEHERFLQEARRAGKPRKDASN
jgi:arylsulfatase A-like enzyme